jgi:hypothetical protein
MDKEEKKKSCSCLLFVLTFLGFTTYKEILENYERYGWWIIFIAIVLFGCWFAATSTYFKYMINFYFVKLLKIQIQINSRECDKVSIREGIETNICIHFSIGSLAKDNIVLLISRYDDLKVSFQLPEKKYFKEFDKRKKDEYHKIKVIERKGTDFFIRMFIELKNCSDYTKKPFIIGYYVENANKKNKKKILDTSDLVYE